MVLTELHYLPLVSYFTRLREDDFQIEAHEHYQKQSLRNRTYILTANGELVLTIPIQHGVIDIQDVKIDYSQDWVKNHLRALESAYKHSPYYDYYFPYFEDIYKQKLTFLFELNLEFFRLIMKMLKWQKGIFLTKKFTLNYESQIIDFRSNYQYRENQESNKPYQQVFGTEFIPNLSILDLLFNKGPDSYLFL